VYGLSFVFSSVRYNNISVPKTITYAFRMQILQTFKYTSAYKLLQVSSSIEIGSISRTMIYVSLRYDCIIIHIIYISAAAICLECKIIYCILLYAHADNSARREILRAIMCALQVTSSCTHICLGSSYRRKRRSRHVFILSRYMTHTRFNS